MTELARRLAAVMFADVVGYTRLMAEDESAGALARRRHGELARPLVERYGGQWIEERGDESLSIFQSALDAVNCALAIQAASVQDSILQLRIGIHLGDVVFENQSIYGDGVNVAARVREHADEDGLVVSGEVWQSVRNQPNLETTSLGLRKLKNVDRPVALFRIRGTPGEPASTPLGEATPSDSSEIRSLAVLPLANLSGDPEQEHLADGMTESLIGELAKIRSLRVTSRTSIMQYKTARKPLPEIARGLKVDGIIEGSVVREGDRVRVTAQLIDGRHDHLVWVDRYERDVRGILALQSEIARTIPKQIRLQLTPREEELLAGPLARWFAKVRRLDVPED